MGPDASLRKRPTDPLLVMLPAGLWVISLACDFLYLGSAAAETWSGLALYSMVGGLIAAFAVMTLPGFVTDMTAALVVAGLYALNVWLRLGDPESLALPIALSLTGVGVLAASRFYRDTRARPAR